MENSSVALSNLDLHTLEHIPRSVLQDLQRKLTPKMTKYIAHVPTPKQTAFMLLDNKEAFYGGAAGGGKSDCLLMCGLQHVDIKGYSGIIFRKSYADLVKPGALIDRSKEWLFRFPDVRWVDKEKKFEFLRKYGPHTEVVSILQFGYLENDNDRLNYQGGEYQFIGFDELTHMSETCYRYMFSRMRRLIGTDVPLRMRGASNPPDDGGGQWVYDRFVNPKTRSSKAIFVPAGLNDNPFLDKEAYLESLNELDPVTRARLRDGVWTITRKGNMFKRDWFETVDIAPQNRTIVRGYDMAATDPEKAKKKYHGDPDYTVGARVSRHRDMYLIEDIERLRKNPAETQKKQQEVAESDTRRVKILMEQEPGSAGVISIQHYQDDVFKGYDFESTRATGSKIERANPVSALAEKGKIKILRGCRNIDEFFNEAEAFPGGAHDDIVDAISLAIGYLMTLPDSTGQIPIWIPNEGSYWSAIESEYNYGFPGMY